MPAALPRLPACRSAGVTLGYSELKQLIVSSVDKVQDAADKTITGGRLNVTAAMLALDAMLAQRGGGGPQPASGAPGAAGTQPVAPVAPNPNPPVQPAAPQPPATNGTQPPALVCGGSALAGLNSAVQSSTAGGAKANAAIDGKCSKQVQLGSCSQTRECVLHAGGAAAVGGAARRVTLLHSQPWTPRLSPLPAPDRPPAPAATPSPPAPLILQSMS